MANDLNQCSFIGNLGKDPELKYFPSGDAFVNVQIAVGRSWKDKTTGEKKDVTTWVPLSFNGPIAEVVGKYCKKGSKIFVQGEFTVRKYTDKDGVDKYQTDIRVNNIQLLGDAGGQRPQQSAGGGGAATSASRPAAQKPAAGAAGYDDDIPF